MLTTDELARLRAMCERLIAADEANDGIALSAAIDAFSELMPEDVLELLRVYEAVLAAPEVELTDCNNPTTPLPADYRAVTWAHFPTRMVRIVELSEPLATAKGGEHG